MIKPLKTEKQYENHLERINALMQRDLKENSKESNEV